MLITTMRVRIKVRLIDILVKHIISILPALSSKPFKTRAYLVPWPSNFRIIYIRDVLTRDISHLIREIG